MPAETKPRLWMISELYYPELTSTGYYITNIAESLTDALDVRVMCGQPNYAARGERSPRSERLNDVGIVRVSGLRLDKNVLLFRLLNMLTLSVSVLFEELAAFKKGDSVLVVTTPPLLPMITAAAALMRGAGYTLLVHDVYPEQLIATGILRKRSITASLVDLFSRWAYKHARGIIVVGRDMKDLLQRKTADLDIPVTYIPNWGETVEITAEPKAKNELLDELDLQDKFIVLYAGNFGRPNDLETILAAAEILSTDERVQFLFIGSGAKEKWLKHHALELPNVLVLPPMPRERQNVFLNACDVTIASLVHGMRGAAVPSRVYNYLAAGKPILAVCERGSEMDMIIEEDNVGARIEPGAGEDLAQAIRELMDSPDPLSTMGTKARTTAVSKYSREKVLPRYHDLLVDIK